MDGLGLGDMELGRVSRMGQRALHTENYLCISPEAWTIFLSPGRCKSNRAVQRRGRWQCPGFMAAAATVSSQ